MTERNIDELRESIFGLYRYDGRRFWQKLPTGEWLVTRVWIIDLHLRVEFGIRRSEAQLLRQEITRQHVPSSDTDFWSQVRWHRFTRGRHLFVALG